MNWKITMSQLRAVASVELRRYRRGRRWLTPFLLAILPNTMMFVSLLLGFAWGPGGAYFRRVPIAYTQLFEDMWLRFMIFFSCVILFSQLFRSEILEKTLHHYYLVPIRREAVVLGKYLSSVIAAIFVFSTATALNYFLFFWPSGEGREFLLTGLGISHMFRYVAIAALACAAYGSIFLFIGMTFRNPMIPALFVMFWEMFNFALPSFFQHLSVTLYLRSFEPVTILRGPFGITVEPPSPLVSAGTLLLASAALVFFCSYILRYIQITYSTD